MVLRTAGLSTGQSVVRVLYVIGVGWTEAIHGLQEDGPGGPDYVYTSSIRCFTNLTAIARRGRQNAGVLTLGGTSFLLCVAGDAHARSGSSRADGGRFGFQLLM
jgi:hypothetical protein